MAVPGRGLRLTVSSLPNIRTCSLSFSRHLGGAFASNDPLRAADMSALTVTAVAVSWVRLVVEVVVDKAGDGMWMLRIDS